jgi:O-antigen/teichoic acid export membrane protein
VPASRFSQGVAILVTGTAVAQLVVAVTAPILTRLYDPSAVGTYAVATSVISILVAVTCLRYEFAIPLPESDVAAADVLALALLTNVGTSLLVGAFLVVLGPRLVEAFGVPILGPVILLIPLGQFGGGFVAAFTSWAIRTRSFAAIASTRLTQSGLMVGFQVAFGTVGATATGLLSGDVGGRIAGSIPLIRSTWRGQATALRGITWSGIVLAAKRYRRFPIYSSGSALLNALGMEVPLLLIVALFGTHAGGEYAIAQRVVALPVTLLATAVGQVYVAEAARLVREDPNALRGLFGETTRRLALVAIVPGVMLAVLAPLLAKVVFGPEWGEVGLFVTILAPMYYLQLLTSPTGGTLDVLERQDLHLVRELMRLILITAVVVMAASLQLSPLATIVALSVIGSLVYVVYGLISWRALTTHGTARLGPAWPIGNGTGVDTHADQPSGTLHDSAGIAVLATIEGLTPASMATGPLAVDELAGPAAPASARGSSATAPPISVGPLFDVDGPPAASTANPPISIQSPEGPGPSLALAIHVPNSYQAERRYVIDVVLREWLGLDCSVRFEDRRDVMIVARDHPQQGRLTMPDGLFAMSSDDWLTERSMPTRPLRWAVAEPGQGAAGTGGSIPVLFGDEPDGDELIRPTTSGTALPIDIFGSLFFMLTRYEEVVRGDRDSHDRFPARSSIAYEEGFLDRPIVDEYVDLLWAAIQRVWPGVSRRPTAFQLRLSHDVDEPWATVGRPVRTIARGVAGDVIRRRDPALAARRAASLVRSRSGRVEHDPYNTFDFLMETAERHGLSSTFYFLAGNTAGEIDGSYLLSDPPVERLLRSIADRGHGIGLHASYGTYQSSELTRMEFEALKTSCAALGIEPSTWAVRQHFLRFANPQTWRNHNAAGISIDSTLGFADQVGFRAGTCREFPLFDLIERRPMALRERPLVVMDTTLFSYLGLNLDRAAARTRSIVDACRRHRGEAVLCFHNSRLTGRRHREFYRDLVADLVRGE